MSTVKGLCPGRFKNGRPCVVRPRFGKVCSYHRKLGRHSRAVASARDEVVRAAVAWKHHDGGDDSYVQPERYAAMRALEVAVAAYEKLAGGA